MTQTEESPFELECYLRKLVTINTHIDCLAHYAHSPRLRRHFYNKKFSVETVSQLHATVVMPKPQDWKRVVTDVLESVPDLLVNHGPRLTDMLVTLRRRNRGTVRAPVHCGCALIAHYQSRPKSIPDVAPLEYIGVSKLSCKACVLFFEVSNSLTSSRFCTRGSHHKWYFPWAMPKCDPKISDEFVVRLANYLSQALEFQGIARRKYSDSSAGSDESNKEDEELQPDPNDVLDRAVEYLDDLDGS